MSRLFGSSAKETPASTTSITSTTPTTPTTPASPVAPVTETTPTTTDNLLENNTENYTENNTEDNSAASPSKRSDGSARGTPPRPGSSSGSSHRKKNRRGHSGNSGSIGLGLRYATLIESYSAMMGQVELLGDQLLEERNTIEVLKEKEQAWLRKEADYTNKIKSYRSRLDVEMSLGDSRGREEHSKQGAALATSATSATSPESPASPASPTSSDRRMIYKMDALEGHVLKLREL